MRTSVLKIESPRRSGRFGTSTAPWTWRRSRPGRSSTRDQIRDLAVERQNRAKQLIEDFMIAANGVTARYLEAKGFASLRRVVRSPERWEQIVAVAAPYGVRLPADPDSKALAQFLSDRRAADPVRFPDLSLTIVKLMGRGEYAVELPGDAAPGHFGLAVMDYTHSTAPNRRYPDLITQRLLKAAMAGAPAPYGRDELTELASHCTQKEDDANKVERQVGKSAAAMLLGSRIGEQFDAIITGASAEGDVGPGVPAAGRGETGPGLRGCQGGRPAPRATGSRGCGAGVHRFPASPDVRIVTCTLPHGASRGRIV